MLLHYSPSLKSLYNFQSLPSFGGSAIPSTPCPSLDPTKLALMLETRPIPHLSALLIHMMGVVPVSWTFKFIGSEASFAPLRVSRALRPYLNSGKLVLMELPSQYNANDREQVSRMFTDLALY